MSIFLTLQPFNTICFSMEKMQQTSKRCLAQLAYYSKKSILVKNKSKSPNANLQSSSQMILDTFNKVKILERDKYLN